MARGVAGTLGLSALRNVWNWNQTLPDLEGELSVTGTYNNSRCDNNDCEVTFQESNNFMKMKTVNFRKFKDVSYYELKLNR